MTTKIRRIDFHPDEYIAGVSKLTLSEQGVYWMICALIYSHGKPIEDDHQWLSRMFHEAHWRTIRAAIERLVDVGKVQRDTSVTPALLSVRRCSNELQRAGNRVSKASQNGSQGGRPSKENSTLEKPGGSTDEKLTKNQEPRTKNHNVEEAFSRFWQAYPSRGRAANPRKPAFEKFTRLIRDGQNPEPIVNGAAGYARALDSEGKVGTQYVMQATRFLTQAAWEQYAAPPLLAIAGGMADEPKMTRYERDDAESFIWRSRNFRDNEFVTPERFKELKAKYPQAIGRIIAAKNQEQGRQQG